jgi:hypothetical protein
MVDDRWPRVDGGRVGPSFHATRPPTFDPRLATIGDRDVTSGDLSPVTTTFVVIGSTCVGRMGIRVGRALSASTCTGGGPVPRRLIAAVVIALSLAAILAVRQSAAGAAEKKPLRGEAIMHGLDYLHTKQQTGGGFAFKGPNSSAIETPWVMLAISTNKESPSRWVAEGGNPFGWMQTQDLVTAATSDPERVNAPAFYAQCILAYVASGKPNSIFYAGSGSVDLVSKMNAYRPSGSDYYSRGGGKEKVATTSWAILGLAAADEQFSTWDETVTWLHGQANGDGGFSADGGGDSSVDATCAAILALRAGKVAKDDPVIVAALAYLETLQRDNGGFERSAGDDRSYAEPTAWAMQALSSCGISPDSWNKPNGTPSTFLKSLQIKPGHANAGAFRTSAGNSGANPLRTSSVALVGRGATTKRYLPYSGLAKPLYAPRWRPEFKSFTPANKATFKTSTVAIVATYADNPGGTGIRTPKVRLTVDGKDKTKPAAISASRLSLRLTGLANGSHTVMIKLADWAGNTRSSTHTFTVARPTSSPTPTPTPTPTHTTVYPTRTPTPTHTSPTPTIITPPPTSTYPPSSTSPYPPYSTSPGPTDTSYPYLSPSPSGSSALGAPGEGGGTGSWPMTALAVALVALVPIGALASYIRRQRLAASLAGASQGKVLPGGGSAWQRFKGHFTRGGSAPAAGE